MYKAQNYIDRPSSIYNIITIMSSSLVALSYVTDPNSTADNEGEECESGTVKAVCGQWKQYRALNEFLTTHCNSATLLFVSGTLLEPHKGFFSELAGKDMQPVIFPDLRKATQKMTLIPDRWRLTKQNFEKKLPPILETIRAIDDREKQPIYLWALNSDSAAKIKGEIGKLGLKDIFVDYYRSDRSLGVERSERICILVGMAEIPSNSWEKWRAFPA